MTSSAQEPTPPSVTVEAPRPEVAADQRPRIGAYILPGDPTWLRSSLTTYYALLDDLVVPVPEDFVSWTGARLPVEECLEAIREIDTRGLMRTVVGRWVNPEHPLTAETAQRQAAIAALHDADWVLQVDNDEILPDTAALLDHMQAAADERIPAVEWPMRVLFRRLRGGRYLEVVGVDGKPRFDYPGPIAIRPDQRLVGGRRTDGRYLRPVVMGDDRSVQVVRDPEPGEVRRESLQPEQAILHNSWGRRPAAVWRKLRSSGHREGLKTLWYYGAVWWPAPLTWRRLRNFHLLYRPLWPRLSVLDSSLTRLVLPEDRG